MPSIQRMTTIQNTFAPKPLGPRGKKERRTKNKTKKKALKTAALNPTEQLSKGKTAGIKKRTNNTRTERKKHWRHKRARRFLSTDESSSILAARAASCL